MKSIHIFKLTCALACVVPMLAMAQTGQRPTPSADDGTTKSQAGSHPAVKDNSMAADTPSTADDGTTKSKTRSHPAVKNKSTDKNSDKNSSTSPTGNTTSYPAKPGDGRAKSDSSGPMSK